MQEDDRLQKADIVPNGVVGAAHDDLDHDAIAQVVSRLAYTVDAPSNIALFGPWGSGKSSLYEMVRERISVEATDVALVKYDAWKFGGTMLQRNFLTEVAEQLSLPKSVLENLASTTEVARLRLGRFLSRNRWSLLGALAIALGVAALYVIGIAGLNQLGKTTWKHEALELIPTGVGVVGLVIAGLLLSNQTLVTATEKRSTPTLQDADQFSAAFKRLMTHLKADGKKTTSRLVVFVDELDRCKPEDVVSVLISLKTFLDHDDCVFIVAADRDVLREALEEAPQAKPVREDEPYYSTAGAFIDKIFQHQIALPPVRAEALVDYAMTLADKQGGLWAELREQDRRAYEDVVYALVPAHVRSPRRVKVLMNNFVTTSRVVSARRLHRDPEPAEIAVLTVLQTEFPSVVDDLVHEPRLLEALAGSLDAADEAGADARLRDLVQQYDPDEAHDDDNSPAGPLLTDVDADETKQRAAQQKLNQQLDSYLSYIHGADIPFPRLDLIYLQDAASAQAIGEPTLQQFLDIAHVHAPDQSLSRFDDASRADTKAAAQFLTTRANTTFGPARANLIELACRLVQTMELDDITDVAPLMTPTIIGETAKGRWREQATPGALMLGLLDPATSDPLSQMSSIVDDEVLLRLDAFDLLIPIMNRVEHRKIAYLHTLIVGVYPQYREPLHAALRELDASAAERLWDDVRGDWESIEQDAMAQAASAAAAATPSAAATPVTETAEESVDQDLYEDLLDAVALRTSPASNLGHDLLMYGLRKDAEGHYSTAYSYASNFIDAVISDPACWNSLALTAIANGPANDIPEWAALLHHDSDVQPAALSDAFDRVRAELASAGVAEMRALVSIHNDLASMLTVAAISEHVDALVDLLHATPFEDADTPTHARRTAIYEILQGLNHLLDPEQIATVQRNDIEQFVTSGADLDPAMQDLIQYTKMLPAESASEIDTLLAGWAKQSAQTLLVTRLRVHARSKASKAPLALSAFKAHLDDSVASSQPLADWFETNPALKDVQAALQRSTVGAPAIAAYAAQRTTPDRSKLWVTLEQANYGPSHLTAIGRLGIDATVVDHMADGLLDLDLNGQRERIVRLLTAETSQNASARRAISELAIALLEDGRTGSGKSAATIVIKAGGAGTGKTDALRRAFDDFTAEHPTALGGDLRRIDGLHLLSKRKKSPVAKFLNWFRADPE